MCILDHTISNEKRFLKLFKNSKEIIIKNFATRNSKTKYNHNKKNVHVHVSFVE